VLFDRFMIEEQFGWRVAENCPDALRVYRRFTLLETSTAKVCKEGRFFY
jgi:hypothetical protein